jgi:voltage-dependent calcium channel
MYQIMSSENWTQILYAATEFQTQYHIAWISATFFIAWFIVANSELHFRSNTDRIAVVLSMFIAIIVQCPFRINLT